MLLEDRNVDQIFIPVAMTGKWQPLDVMVNRVFKAFYKAEYHAWRQRNNEETKSGYLKKPGRQDFVNMVSAAWGKVDLNCVRKSFEKSEIIEKTSVSGSFGDEIVGEDEDRSFLEISSFQESSFIDMEDSETEL
jgi:hypothetical protein